MEEQIEYATHIVVCEECGHYDNTGCIDGVGICKRNGRVKENREYCEHGKCRDERINAKGTGSTYLYGVNADAIKATCGKNITPVSGGTAQFFNADGTLDVNSYGEGGTWTKNGQYWTPARNFNGTSVGGWDSAHFDVGQRISGVLYGTWS